MSATNTYIVKYKFKSGTFEETTVTCLVQVPNLIGLGSAKRKELTEVESIIAEKCSDHDKREFHITSILGPVDCYSRD